MIRFKEGVQLARWLKNGRALVVVKEPAIVVPYLVEPIFDELSLNVVVTSFVDGKHGKVSEHNVGHGVDLRSRHIWGSSQKHEVLDKMREVLEPLGYDVLLEYEGEEDEHYHVEYQVKVWELAP